MQASAWSGGSKRYPVYGIRVGAKNRDAHFESEWSEVTVLINGSEETFRLTPGFWNKCPEIRDNKHRAMRRWLDTHYGLPWPYKKPPRFQLIPLGSNRFELLTAHPQTQA